MADTAMRRRRSRYRLFPHWFTRKRVLALIVVATVAVGGTFGARVAIELAKLTRTNPFDAALSAIGGGGNSTVGRQVKSLQRINIALYGYGGPPHDGPYLSDSIMVVSIQPQASGPPQVAEVSVPRDWYVPIDLGNGQTDNARINEAYADGMEGMGPTSDGPTAGASVANPTLEHLLGVHIDHWIGIDFHAFQAGVDAVSGVDINVPDAFTDDQYPSGDCSDGGDCSVMSVHFDAGIQHMDGSRALIFARSRHSEDNGEGSDFARSKRQQLVVAAIKEKVVGLGGIGSLPDLLGALSDHVVTDLQVNDMEALYDLVKGVDTSTIEHVSINDTNFLYQCDYPTSCGAAYIFAHDQTYGSIQRFEKNIMPPPDVVGEHAAVTFLDASGNGMGASAIWSSLFQQIGFTTTDGDVTDLNPTTHVIDASNGKDAKTAKWLADYFDVKVEKPAAGTATSNAGITVVLGQDEEAVFNNANSS